MLYSLPTSFYNDVTSGNNGLPAGPGYDLVTGIGTPIANQLIPAFSQPYVESLSASPDTVVSPNSVMLTASVGDLNGTISSVSFYQRADGGDVLLGTDTDGSDGWSLTTSTAGLNGVTAYYAVAQDTNGTNSVATSTDVTISAPPAVANYVTTDTTTQGNWTGVYGSDGYSIFNGNSDLPSYAQLSSTDALNWTWPTNNSDPRGLQTSSGATTRIAACDYSTTSFTLNLNLTDGQSHQVAIYLLDWEPANRTETVQVSDAVTNTVLGTRNASNFGNGQWLVWNLTGNVKITFTNTGPLDSVVSGIFFGPVPVSKPGTASFVTTDTSTQGNWTGIYGSDGYSIFNGNSDLPSYAQLSSSNALNWTWPTDNNDPRGLQTSAGAATRIAACDYSTTSFTLNLNLTDGQSHQVAIYLLDWEPAGRTETVQVSDALTNTVLDTRSASNFGNGQWLVWNLSGSVNISFTNTGPLDSVASGVFFGSVPVSKPGTASFVGADTSTQGNWTGIYGSDGYSIFNGNSDLPSYAQLSSSNALNWTWPASNTDPRGLQTSAGSTSRIEACDYSTTSFTLDLNLIDGQTHQVAIYLLDWEPASRTETVQVTDALTNTVLDTQSASNFGNGQWLVWNLSGAVKITFTNTGPLDAVASGIFFDPVPSIPTTATASFVAADTMTQGNWTGHYGSDGYSIFNGSNDLPSYARLSSSNALNWTWPVDNADPRGLQISSGSASRIEACDYSTTHFTLDLNLIDGQTHQVAIYLLDWEPAGRTETVQISDALTNTVLDTQSASNFGNGQWLVWNLTGNVKITFTNSGPLDAVASGIFFG